MNEEHNHSADNQHNHHEMMVNDFKNRFLISFILMIPILLLSPMIQSFLSVDWRFSYDYLILFLLSTVLIIYGGKPFFLGSIDELKRKEPAMMTLIAFAISVAYVYSSFVVFWDVGTDFFWELATLMV